MQMRSFSKVLKVKKKYANSKVAGAIRVIVQTKSFEFIVGKISTRVYIRPQRSIVRRWCGNKKYSREQGQINEYCNLRGMLKVREIDRMMNEIIRDLYNEERYE